MAILPLSMGSILTKKQHLQFTLLFVFGDRSVAHPLDETTALTDVPEQVPTSPDLRRTTPTERPSSLPLLW